MDPTSYRRRLPHWRVVGATYFVTWRLHRMQLVLTPPERREVLEVVQHSNGDRFLLHAAVVMDDHAHAIVRPYGGQSLEAIVRNWKACAVARLRIHGRVAPFWQREYHDRIIRSRSDLVNKIRYIAQNPVTRWPGITDYAALYLRTDE